MESKVSSVDTDEIKRTLSEFPVAVGILYGSHARGDATKESDIDLAVEFVPGLSSVERTRARLGIIERLSRRLENDAIDVVPLSRVSPELGRAIQADGIVILGSSEAVPPFEGTELETRADRLEAFDEVLADIERVV